MAVVHHVGHSEEQRDVIGRMANDRHEGPGAEWMILLTVTAVAGMEVELLAWLIS
jgi:hypothetical protein